jgi:predicted transcriptional regulator
MIVYATAPLSQLVGEFRVGRVLTGTPAEVCAETGPDPLKSYTASYLRGARSCTAVEVIDPQRWDPPMPLARFRPRIRAPQSYVFMKENDGLFRDH